MEKTKLDTKSLKKYLLDQEITMIGEDGLNNIENILNMVKAMKIEGDFVETGVWRGGACIWARAVMDELELDGDVYACESFEGLPKPNVKDYPADEGDAHHLIGSLSKSLDVVKEYFNIAHHKYGMSDKVYIVKGWFKDTMPELAKEIGKISVLRLDGDMYESTIQVLEALYDKVVKGGFIIIDDYCLEPAIKATDDFRKARNIVEPLISVNHAIRYWQKV
jgi:hypothetical protein